MKKACFNSLREFYDNIKEPAYCSSEWKDFVYYQQEDSPMFKGLPLADINRYKFSYEVGVEKLRDFKDFEVEKDIHVKYWNQFDGFDIDIDRMYDNLDFLLDTRRQRKLPKTIDVYVNIGEPSGIKYDAMLNKTYAAIKVVDRLESLGVRCAVYACAPALPKMGNGNNFGELHYLEICVKNYHDTLNTGAICAAISPWMLRHWIFLWRISHIKGIKFQLGLSASQLMPKDINGIIIETGSCHNLYEANQFIQNLKVA